MHIATTHTNTDFDGLASVIAVTLLYPDCIGVVPKMTNKNVGQFLSTHKTAFRIILPNEVRHVEVKSFMARDVVTISTETTPNEAARLMIQKNVGYLPVVQKGKVIGMVARTDILTYYYGLLPD